MLIRFHVTRKDTGANIPGARIEVEKAETVGFTNQEGIAEIVTYWSGNWIYKVTASGYGAVTGTVNNRDIPVLNFAVSMLYEAKSEPAPPGPNEEILERVGTSCSIINNFSFNRSFYQVRHDRKGNLSSLVGDLEETRAFAYRRPECFEIPPPPPKTISEVAEEVTTLQKLLNSTVGKIENLTQGIGDIIRKAEAEAAAWRQGLLDLEGRLKSWIQDMILELLLAKLMEGRINDSRR